MKSIRIRLLVAAMAVVFAAAVAKSQSADTQAATMHHHEFGFGDHMMGFFADYLNLSEAQQTQMKAVMAKEHATLKPLVQQLHQTHQQLRQYEEGAYDEAKVRAVAAQESQTVTELTVQKIRIHSELFQMLTPDQQAKMKEFEARHEARMQKRMQKRMSQAPSGPPEE
jgi:Spy/CpxP family protein refolding chaperone